MNEEAKEQHLEKQLKLDFMMAGRCPRHRECYAFGEVQECVNDNFECCDLYQSKIVEI